MSWFVGIDPGSQHCGLAALHEDGRARHVVIHPTGDVPDRLVYLRREVRYWLARVADEGAWCCVVERPGTRHGGATLLAAYGVVVEAARSLLACPVLDVASATWKARSVGAARASAADVLARAEELGCAGCSLDAAVAACCADTARVLSAPVRGANGERRAA